ncbi:Rrf2 family transcriptional regulator [Geobacter sp. SVR]|uniref:RrF2 family transcriptional regulator n=1 Tax=Geobacter sp. SVR TaxID=2495594 RepID=UPI00143EF4F7|nr:RrF2 family transcriptional regulator [Geobacter sp. SVR]BCS55146.1 Rrf2 family transcriptional regulator [Geobacter sp. SVR]GCF85327.1 Rrf2 family transcriptional regulator [Geobacter sp. SVR]
MRLSTKSRYGLRALFDIAYNSGGAPAQIQDISRRQQISPRYLEQIFQTLKRAGILRSKRGPQGGYCLARKPDEITVLEILNATEQDVLLVNCGGTPLRKPRRQTECPFEGNCVTQTVWEEASTLINNLFAGMTLQTLCERGQAMGIERELTAG